MWYHVSEVFIDHELSFIIDTVMLTSIKPNSYLAITGAHIESVKIAKKAFIQPFQKVSFHL